MVGWHLLLLLVVEVTLYGAAARHLHQHYGWSVMAATAFAIALYLGIRVVLIGLEFLLTRWQGDPIPPEMRVPAGGLAKMYVRELGGWLLMFSLILPFVRSRRSVIDRHLDMPVRRTPVLLIHGLACNRGNWFWFRRRLEEKGLVVFTVDVTPPFARIDDFAPQAARAVDEILAATGADRVILIGHSMGGLVARAYLDQFGDGKVAHVITLGSPHQGTWMTRFALGPNLRNMDLNSRWLAGLREREAQRAPQPYTGFTCVYTLHDNLVTPQKNATLPGAEVIRLSGVGHLSMALSRPVFERVAAVLARVAPEIRDRR